MPLRKTWICEIKVADALLSWNTESLFKLRTWIYEIKVADALLSWNTESLFKLKMLKQNNNSCKFNQQNKAISNCLSFSKS